MSTNMCSFPLSNIHKTAFFQYEDPKCLRLHKKSVNSNIFKFTLSMQEEISQ